MDSETIAKKALEAKNKFIFDVNQRNILFSEFWNDNKPFSLALEAHWSYSKLREFGYEHEFALNATYIYFKNYKFLQKKIKVSICYFIQMAVNNNLSLQQILDILKQEYDRIYLN